MSTFRNRKKAANIYDLLPPERPRARLLAEQMTRPQDVEDAEFVVISEAPGRPARPAAAQPARRPQNDNGASSRASSSRRSATVPPARGLVANGEGLLRRLSETMFSGLVALVFVTVFALTGGFSAFASSGAPAPARAAVEVSHVTVTPKSLNGMPVLLVKGVIENHGLVTLSSPRLRADVYSGDNLVSSTLFRTLTAEIPTGESRGFQVKLPQAGGKTPDIRIALAD